MKNAPGPGRVLRSPVVVGVPAVTAAPRPSDDPRHPFRERCCDDCGEPARPVMMSCGDRTCGKCRAKWYGQHYKSVLALLSCFNDIRFLTLTERNIADLAFRKAHVVQLRKWFGELRRRFPQILGGVYVVQGTNIGNGWHPHIHALFDGFYIHEKVLRSAWRKITNGSFEVKIKRATDPAKALGYLLSDFLQAPRIRPEDHDVYNEVFRGSRLLQTFGKYWKWKFLVAHAPFKCPKCGCEKSVDREAWLIAAEGRAWDDENIRGPTPLVRPGLFMNAGLSIGY